MSVLEINTCHRRVQSICVSGKWEKKAAWVSDIVQGKESGGSNSDFQKNSHSDHFDENNLSDLIRNLNLATESSELLASRLKEKNVLHFGANITCYRRRENEKICCQSLLKTTNYISCNESGNFLKKIGLPEYNRSEMPLFIDSSERTLKSVLLSNGKQKWFFEIVHSARVKYEYETLSLAMDK